VTATCAIIDVYCCPDSDLQNLYDVWQWRKHIPVGTSIFGGFIQCIYLNSFANFVPSMNSKLTLNSSFLLFAVVCSYKHNKRFYVWELNEYVRVMSRFFLYDRNLELDKIQTDRSNPSYYRAHTFSNNDTSDSCLRDRIIPQISIAYLLYRGVFYTFILNLCS